MAFAPAFLEVLRRRITLSAVVARRVRLVRKGREFEALCPFHHEKSPSFFVNDEKAFYHCFGCGVHGDAISFLIETEGASFVEAVERLAQEAGLEVPRATPADRGAADRLGRIAAALEAAARFFEQQLAGPAGSAAREYLAQRGVAAAEIAAFRIGAAPDWRSALKTRLLKDGFAEPTLIEAGLVIAPEDRPNASAGGETYDRFRHRLMFPIADQRGRVIAFGGRLLAEGQPKYLNSPETPLFAKGRTLYGLHLARAAAVKSGELIIVEGYMDVVALAGAGFAGVVAPLGTALTEDQIAEAWRIAPERTVCFDGDAAGRRAALKAAVRALPLLAPGRSLRFAQPPDGRDPDDLMRQPGGAEQFRRLLSEALPLVELLWRAERDAEPMDTPERRAGFVARLREHTARIADRDIAGFYRDEFAARRDALFGRATANARFSGSAPRRANHWNACSGLRPPAEPAFVKLAPAAGKLRAVGELHARPLLAALINHPELAAEFFEDVAELTLLDPRLDSLRRELVDTLSLAPGLDATALRAHLAHAGFAELLIQLDAPQLREAFPFIRLDAPPAPVAQSFRNLLAEWRSRRAGLERQALAHQAAASADPADWRRFVARTSGDKAHDDAGAASFDLDPAEPNAR